MSELESVHCPPQDSKLRLPEAKKQLAKPKTDRDKTYKETSTVFDYAAIYAADEGIDRDSVVHGPTRDEAEVYLRDHFGLSKRERMLVLGIVFEKKTDRQLEADTGWKKTWIQKQRTRPTIKWAMAELQNGKALLDGTARSPTTKRHGTPSKAVELHEWIRYARESLAGLENPQTRWTALTQRLVHRPLGKGNDLVAVVLIRSRPATLLTDEGRPLLEALVDLLEAANWGVCKRRIPSVTREGKRQHVARAARQALSQLTKPLPGGRLDYNSAILGRLLQNLRVRIWELRKEWKSLQNLPSLAVRREKMRELHPTELAGWTDRELDGILREGDTFTAAARFAEKVTGISAETFKRGYRDRWKARRLNYKNFMTLMQLSMT